jgi:hypothetical protein
MRREASRLPGGFAALASTQEGRVEWFVQLQVTSDLLPTSAARGELRPEVQSSSP